MPPADPQLPLPFPHAPSYDPRDFVAAKSNQEALAWLASDWPDRRLAIWGPAGCGKSHLLQIWAERTGARVVAGGVLADRAISELIRMPTNAALALDNAKAVSPEPLLLHLLNIARDRGLRLLMVSRTPPSRWPVRLPDLCSRLRAIPAVEIKPPADDLLAALLARLLADRQLSVTPAVQGWLLTRLPRSPGALRRAVGLLDQASLASGRPITRPLAARVLESHAVDDGNEVSISGIDPSSDPPGFL